MTYAPRLSPLARRAAAMRRISDSRTHFLRCAQTYADTPNDSTRADLELAASLHRRTTDDAMAQLRAIAHEAQT